MARGAVLCTAPQPPPQIFDLGARCGVSKANTAPGLINRPISPGKIQALPISFLAKSSLVFRIPF
jgi:hypothetical protein